MSPTKSSIAQMDWVSPAPTVRADSTPDESMSQTYMALDDQCHSLIRTHGDPVQTVAACKAASDVADGFASGSHFITRRAAYVYYTAALIRANKPKDAVATGEKAVAVVLLGHDDEIRFQCGV